MPGNFGVPQPDDMDAALAEQEADREDFTHTVLLMADNGISATENTPERGRTTSCVPSRARQMKKKPPDPRILPSSKQTPNLI
eukprot:jgi/Psemu1/8650/gm1.8650_g